MDTLLSSLKDQRVEVVKALQELDDKIAIAELKQFENRFFIEDSFQNNKGLLRTLQLSGNVLNIIRIGQYTPLQGVLIQEGTIQYMHINRCIEITREEYLEKIKYLIPHSLLS